MKNNNLIETLKKRNLIFQITNEKELLIKIKKRNFIVLYCGFDPTADSLHIGHLIPLICLKYFQEHGHKPIVLIGGATGIIGDPSFKSKKRNNKIDMIYYWSQNIKKQLSSFLDFECGQNSAVIVNNYDWFNKINILDFLYKVGNRFSINQMINKKAIRKRLKNDNIQGLSYTEFTYNLLQSYDFYYLNKKYDAILQIGGSDQWGNIISGIHLTHILSKKKIFGITVPLMTNKNGNKIGKSENHSIWLDKNKTSPYHFYQFWLNTDDDNMDLFFKIFTNIDIEEIKLKNKSNNPRLLQKVLAEYITKFVHGSEGLCSAKKITYCLFKNKIQNLEEKDFIQISKGGMLKINLNKSEDLQQALVISKLSTSRTQSKNMIMSNSISINGKKISNIYYFFSEQDKIFNKFTLLCRGKKNYCLIEWNK